MRRRWRRTPPAYGRPEPSAGVVVVIAPPEVQLPSSVGQVEEHLHVQAFVAQPTVEALDITVLDRPPWPDEVQMHTVTVGPVIQLLRGELGTVAPHEALEGTIRESLHKFCVHALID